jgi:hypothetical protein
VDRIARVEVGRGGIPESLASKWDAAAYELREENEFVRAEALEACAEELRERAAICYEASYGGGA